MFRRLGTAAVYTCTIYAYIYTYVRIIRISYVLVLVCVTCICLVEAFLKGGMTNAGLPYLPYRLSV